LIETGQFHPRKNEAGAQVEILRPTRPSELTAWTESGAIATVIPGGAMPSSVCGISIESWTSAPRDDAGWEALAAAAVFDDPPFAAAAGKNPASGAVVVEADGRIWVVSPTNRFGGYVNTFPKGTMYPGQKLSMRANALKEVFEETGLHVELIAFLVDAERDTSTTRYYLARRLGGNPADMGWESQAVHLVPPDRLRKFVPHGNDRAVVAASLAACGYS
jgi:ADP-ribose pyrophosphatase YjhB (NUDIX family)